MHTPTPSELEIVFGLEKGSLAITSGGDGWTFDPPLTAAQTKEAIKLLEGVSDDWVPGQSPNWDKFNEAMLADIPFNQYQGACLQLAPAVATAIPTALSQVSSNGVSAFKIAYNAFVQITEVTVEHRESWAQLAENFNLPTGFIAVVRG